MMSPRSGVRVRSSVATKEAVASMSVYENDQGRPTLGFMFGLPGEPLLRPPVGAVRPESAPDGGALAAPLQPAWPPVEQEVVVRGGVRVVPDPPDEDPPPPAA